jgi:hypothetical protein
MSVFRRKSSKPPASREALVEQLDSMRPGAPQCPRQLAPEDVTGLLDLALERLQHAHDTGAVALLAATERLLEETHATQALAKRLSTQPPPKP